MLTNNYDATLTALTAYLVANAPVVTGDHQAARDVGRLARHLEAGAELADYLAIEFRPAQDLGCQFYVRIEGAEGRFDRARIMDEEGNRWYGYKVKCEVSWATWGSSDVVTCQRRLALMTEVTRFACEVERVFSGPIHRLDATAEQIKEQAISYKKEAAIHEVERLVKAHAKGMKVGDTKSVVIDPKFDMTAVGAVQVERKEAGRTFRYTAGVHEAGLVYFMRLDS